jgi:hypothetical protein
MTFKIHRPSLILKDRPYLEDQFELDLGEMTITCEEKFEKGRFKRAPE